MKINKALSIKQPWLWLILHHFKDIEVRTWNTNFRGYLALHASKTFDSVGYDYLVSRDKQMPLKHHFEKGMILGIADLHDVIIFKDAPHFFQYRARHLNNMCWWDGKQKGFVLQDIKQIPTIKMKGKLKLFNIDIEVEEDGTKETSTDRTPTAQLWAP